MQSIFAMASNYQKYVLCVGYKFGSCAYVQVDSLEDITLSILALEKWGKFLRLLHGYKICNNYGQCFRELIALYTKLCVRLSACHHSDTHIRAVPNVSVERRLKSRSFI